MRKATAAVLLCSMFALCLGGCFWINAQTSAVSNGSALPVIKDGAAYTISGIADTEHTSEIIVRLETAQAAEELALLVEDMGSYTLYQNDQIIYVSAEDDGYSRFQLIPLQAQRAGQALELRFQSASVLGNRVREIISGRLNAPPKLLITTAAHASRMEHWSFAFSYVLIGQYFIIFATCLLLYCVRRTDKSYIAAAMVSALLLLTCALNSGLLSLHVTLGKYYLLRPLLSVLPIVLHVSLGVYLLNDSLPQWYRRVFSLPAAAGLTLLMAYVQMVSERSCYRLFMLIAYLAAATALLYALRTKARGSLLLAAGFCLRQATVPAPLLCFSFTLSTSG